jgi:membrane associated rhomboid family serine protease
MTQGKSNRFLDSISLPLKFVLLLWAIHLVQFLLHLDFGVYGLYPRTTFGLRGILFAPLLHSDWGHLISNTPPLFALSAIIMFFYRKVAVPSFFMIYLLTGLAVWIFGRSVFHIGASGVVYGLVSFVFWNGIFRRNLKSIVLALIVIFYYGSMFMGILPGQEGISWESHLLGAVVGIFVSFWYKDSIEKDEEKKTYSWENEPQTLDQPFLDPHIFEKTKAERKREKEQDSSWFSSNTWE